MATSMTIREALQLAAQYQQAGQASQAEQIYRQILQADPSNAEVHYYLGNLFALQGRMSDALPFYQQAVNLRPQFAEAQCNLGNVLREQGDVAGAQRAFEEALRIRPNFALAHGNLASLLQSLGRDDEALVQFQQASQVDPNLAETHNNLGSLHQSQKRPAEAQRCYEQALRLQPNLATAHYNLAKVLNEQGRPAEALASYQRCLQIDPRNVEAHNNLGNLLHAEGQLSAAVASFQQALKIKPDHAAVHNNLGSVYKDLGRFSEAMACFSKALELKPNHAETHCNLGSALRKQGRWTEAAAEFRETLRLKPSLVAAHCNLASVLQDQGDWAESQACFERAMEIAPSDGLKIKAALSLPLVYESLDDLHRHRRRIETNLSRMLGEELRIDEPLHEAGATNFFAAYHGYNDRELQSQLAGLYLRAAPSLCYVADHCRQPAPRPLGRRIRVGFVSQCFYSHSIGKVFAGIIRNLSRDEFHVTVFRTPGHRDDPLTQSIDQSADKLVTLPAVLVPARQQIADEKLDLLFYTDIGQDPWTYFLAFARLAPVQCIGWGHPVTTGIPTLDYFVSSIDLEPEGTEHYTERLVRLPNVSTYYYPPRLPLPPKRRADFGLPDGVSLYMCVQSLFKIHPEFDPLLAEVLRSDRRGRLLLFEGLHPRWSELLLARFRQTIPDVLDRITILPRQNKDEFQHLLSLADVLLDTLHFSGGVTTYEALAAGTPIVTLPGRFLRGRQTYACYRRMGVMDCVAKDLEDYVRLAVRLGTDQQFRRDIHEKILVAKHRLYENMEAVREVEQFFREVIG